VDHSSISHVPGVIHVLHNQETHNELIPKKVKSKENLIMKSTVITATAIALALTLLRPTAFAHGGGKHVKLHVNPRWSECSFQLDPSLTQEAWREFTKEVGPVAYFRPLKDAKPMGVGNYEFSVLQWQTAFDDTKAAWNDTFVHPDSTHWLKDSDRLPLPSITFRTGVANNVDLGVYVTKNPNVNYGLWGGQVQYNFLNDGEANWAASARLSFVSLFGPEDLGISVYGLELLASREYSVYSDWVSVTPYGGMSTYVARSHETSSVVNLNDESFLGVQAMAGVVAQISLARVAVEYNVAVVNTISFKVGIGF
jgi:hypothetical protein